MERQDYELAFMMQYENVAWYEDGAVRILDRRVYPYKKEFVRCTHYSEVAQAITDMVTQSAGPYTAAAMGMALAADQCKTLSADEQLKFLAEAAYALSHARPTTVNRMTTVVNGCLEAARSALQTGDVVSQVIFEHAIQSLNKRYSAIGQVAQHLVKLIPDNGKILTQCFGETIIGTMIREAKCQGKSIEFFCAETRPFFQGARFTATVAQNQGIKVTVLADNMIAYAMQHLGIDLFTSAADSITLDGHVVNKVGTQQIAILAQYYGIPYYVTGIPDVDLATIDQVVIEQRDPQEVMTLMGQRITEEGVQSIYPSFDITGPKLVNGVVTDIGIYSPYDLKSYAENNNKFWS